MLPNLISGLLMGMTVDIYSLYYAPVGIVLGFVTGLVYRKFQPKKWQIFPAAVAITLPSTLISSCITAFLFGRNHLFWFLHSCTASFQNTSWNGRKLFCGPVCHRYIDRVLCLALAAVMIGALRKNMKESFIR